MSLLEFFIGYLICYIETACVFVANAAITGLAALVAAVVAALPDMPTLPAVPATISDGFAYGEYFFPVDYLVTTVGLVGTLWLAWIVIAIPLRWAKATSA